MTTSPRSSAGRDDVVVITGAGGMREAVARRLGRRRAVVVAAATRAAPEQLSEQLGATGHRIHPPCTDITASRHVDSLASTAAAPGRLAAVVHVTAAVELLAGPDASFVAGTDLLPGGDVVAALRHGGTCS